MPLFIVVIIGFANFDNANKIIFEYEDIKGEPHEIESKKYQFLFGRKQKIF